jgi:transposase, IS30 family
VSGLYITTPQGSILTCVVSRAVATLLYVLEVVLSSSRRLKKGPDRRPQSAKRQRLWNCAPGAGPSQRRVAKSGIPYSANNWARGYKTYQPGEAVGFVPALDRLTVRQISDRYLSEEDRIDIADLHRTGVSIRQIAAKLGRAPSTVSRELRRNSRPDGHYRPFEAHRWAVRRRARRHQRRIDKNPALCELIAELLAQRWSPQQIARQLRRKYPEDRSMWLCHESIYQAVYQPNHA